MSANNVMSPARSAGIGNDTGLLRSKPLTDKYGEPSSVKVCLPEVELIKSLQWNKKNVPWISSS